MPESKEMDNSPYFSLVEKIRHKRRKSPEDLIRFRFALFAWKFWRIRQMIENKANLDSKEFVIYANSLNEGDIFNRLDPSTFDELTRVRIDFERRIEKWLEGASLYLRNKLSFTDRINAYTKTLLEGFSYLQTPPNDDSSITYLEKDIGDKLLPILSQFDRDKAENILLVKAGEAVFRLICSYYWTPPDAFLLLNIETGSKLIMSSFSPNSLNAYNARFLDKDFLRIKRIISTCGFFANSDFRLFNELTLHALITENQFPDVSKLDPKNCFNLPIFNSLDDYLYKTHKEDL